MPKDALFGSTRATQPNLCSKTDNIKALNALIRNPEKTIEDAMFLLYKDQIPGADRFAVDKKKFFAHIQMPPSGNLKIICDELKSSWSSFHKFDDENNFHLARYFSFDAEKGQLARNETAWQRYIDKGSLYLNNAEELYAFRLLNILKFVVKELKFGYGSSIKSYLGFDLEDGGAKSWHISAAKYPSIKEKLEIRGVYEEIKKQKNKPLFDPLIFNLDDALTNL